MTALTKQRKLHVTFSTTLNNLNLKPGVYGSDKKPVLSTDTEGEPHTSYTFMRNSGLIFLLGALSLSLAADVKSTLDSSGIIASFPGDETYAAASSSFNLRFSYQPTAITYPRSVEEVSKVVKIGAEAKLPVVARSGGHSYIANGLGGGDGAIVVDLSNLKNITVHQEAGIAIIETGNRLGDIATTLGKFGLGLPHGSCAYVGIGGHAASGGFGFASRMWGLTLDTISAINIVLANGTSVTATSQYNADLFWASRGAASSFGIVTSIQVKIFSAPSTGTIFQYSWDGISSETAATILGGIQRFIHTGDVPPHLGGEINLFKGSVIGEISISFAGGWYAPHETLNATVRPLLAALPPVSRTSFFTGTYLETAENLAGGSLDTTAPDGHDAFYAKSLMTPEASPISDKAMLAYTTYLATEGFNAEVGWFIQMELYGGKTSAINAVSLDATSFAHRRSLFSIQFYSSAPNNVPPYPESGFAFLDGLVSSITSNSPTGWGYGAYPNYIDDRLADWRYRYYGAHYTRLRHLKSVYDPYNVFHFPTSGREMCWLTKYCLFAVVLPITLAADLKGSLTASGISASFPGDSSYSSASAAFNRRFTFAPGAVVYPKTPQEVSQVVAIGASQGLKVVARSGGHSYIANGLGGRNGSIVVDLKNFKKVTVNSAQGTAVIEAGNRLGDVATALANNGRAMPHGTCAYVGIGGHAAYGGFGFASRMWGLSLDTIQAVNIVLANGTTSRVTNDNNPDLFWALRGSAGSFGIVTSYEVKTFTAPPSATSYKYSWNLNFTTAATAISNFQKFVQTNIPSSLGAELVLGKGWSSGMIYFELSGVWYGNAGELNAILDPFLSKLPAYSTKVNKTGTYIQSVAYFAGGSLDTSAAAEERDTFYVKSLMTPESSPISNSALLAFTRYLAVQGFSSKTEWFIEMDLYGGKNSAVNAVPASATAFAQRSSTFTIQLYASSPGRQPPYPQYGFTFIDEDINGPLTFIHKGLPMRLSLTAHWAGLMGMPAQPSSVLVLTDSFTQRLYQLHRRQARRLYVKLYHFQELRNIDTQDNSGKLRYYGDHYNRLQGLKAQYDPKNLFDFPIGVTS
ncbi:hypothetical protein H0H87_007216 [Tephrocybe sp. NHM501043]|nr:hypothetical protein H0H87_007216 [Tephrocybe sp. NHM501043]